jgi:hypothetical protein
MKPLMTAYLDLSRKATDDAEDFCEQTHGLEVSTSLISGARL